MLRFVQRHWEIGLGALERPGGDDGAFVSIHDCDMVRGWDIHEDAWPRLLKLERFGMALERDIAKVLGTCGADETQCPCPIPDIERVGGHVVAYIVSITGQLDSVAVLECGAIKEVARTCLPIGHSK